MSNNTAKIVNAIVKPVAAVIKIAYTVALAVTKTVGGPIYALFEKSPLFQPTVDFLTEHRGWVILFFALPLSFTFDMGCQLMKWFEVTFLASPQLHGERVKYVQDQVRRWNKSGRKKPMCTDRSPFFSMSVRTPTFKEQCNRIHIPLGDILEIDEERMIVRCEPQVTFGMLTKALLPRGLAARIHIEMEDITIGGCTMGMGIEVNSHKHGLIQDNVDSYEVVLADGSLVRASKTENTDLFYALPWSHGTLGFLVSIDVKIMRVKPYMHMTYVPCHSHAEFVKKFQELALADDGPEYLEATIFSHDQAVIMKGDLEDTKTNEDKQKVNSVNYWFKPWFYKHVETSLQKGEFDEFIPLAHYYHRHTRSIFWELEDMIPFGNHPVYRYLLGWLGAPKVSFLKFTMTKQIRMDTINKHVVQEAIVPIEELNNCIDGFREWFDMYPLLVYPIGVVDNGAKNQGMLPRPKNKRPGKDIGVYFDLGAYGVPECVKRKEPYDAKTNIRKMEDYVRSVNGFVAPYTDMFCSREEFEKMFNHTLWRKCRKKYGAEGAFPEIYDKVRVQF